MSVSYRLDEMDREGIRVASLLVAAGVPIFAAERAMKGDDWDPRGGTGSTGYWLPKGWQNTPPGGEGLDAWNKGLALCAVMGVVVDGLDVDPIHGGKKSAKAMRKAGLWPEAIGRQRTPSGGFHDLIATLGVSSLDGLDVGVDLKAGKLDATGRGFLFIAPTVKLSKVDSELRRYEWQRPPRFDRLTADTAGGPGERLISYIEATRAGGKAPSPELLRSPGGLGRNPHTGPIPAGSRDTAVRNYIRLLVGKGLDRDELEQLVIKRWGDMAQPKGNEYPLADAIAKIDVALTKFSANPDAIDDLAIAHALPDELRERLRVKRVGEEFARLRARREASAIDREVEALENPKPPVDFGTLKEMLKRPAAVRWRVEGLLAIEARMLVVAQRKSGKTTLTLNLARSLLTGEPFLGRLLVEPVVGSIVFLNYEVSGATFASWLADIGIPKELHKRVHILNLRGRENLLATERGRRWLEGMLRDAGAEVAIVDPFGRAFTGDEQNSASQVTRFLVELDGVMTAGGVSEVILVAHAGWGDGKSGVRARGSSGTEDWADSILRLSRERDLPGSPRFIEAEGRDVAVDTDRLEYDPQTRLLRLTGTGGATVARKSAKAELLRSPILEIVAATGGITASGIEDALRRLDPPIGFTRGDPSTAVTALVCEGLLERYKDGKSRHHYLPGKAPEKFTNRFSE